VLRRGAVGGREPLQGAGTRQFVARMCPENQLEGGTPPQRCESVPLRVKRGEN